MRYALIENGVVTNCVEAEESWVPPDGCIKVQHTKAQIGWTYDGAAFHAPPVVTEPPSRDAQIASIDAQISTIERKQARAVREHILDDAGAKGRLQTINGQIAALRVQRAAL